MCPSPFVRYSYIRVNCTLQGLHGGGPLTKELQVHRARSRSRTRSWKVKVYPVKVGCRGFVGRLTTRQLKDLDLQGQVLQQAIRAFSNSDLHGPQSSRGSEGRGGYVLKASCCQLVLPLACHQSISERGLTPDAPSEAPIYLCAEETENSRCEHTLKIIWFVHKRANKENCHHGVLEKSFSHKNLREEKLHFGLTLARLFLALELLGLKTHV